VTREQLISRLWPTGVVEFDTGLNSAMRKLRIALGDDADTPRYIETIPRKGYRFIGRIEDDAPITGVPTLPQQYVPTPFETGAVIGRRASDRRAPFKRLAWGFGSILAAIVLGGGLEYAGQAVPGRSTRGEVADHRGPAAGRHERRPERAGAVRWPHRGTSNWLAHIPTLQMRAPAFAFKGTNTDVREIGRQLNATHVLAGSLRRSGNEMRITVQLIEATGGLHIWSRTFDLPLGDIFLIEHRLPVGGRAAALTLSAATASNGPSASRKRWRRMSFTCWAARASASAPPTTTSRRRNSSGAQSPPTRSTRLHR
jgi:hypothetical protein